MERPRFPRASSRQKLKVLFPQRFVQPKAQPVLGDHVLRVHAAADRGHVGEDGVHGFPRHHARHEEDHGHGEEHGGEEQEEALTDVTYVCVHGHAFPECGTNRLYEIGLRQAQGEAASGLP